MTEQNPNTTPTPFLDSIILVFKDRLQLEVFGRAKDAARFRRPWGHKAKVVKEGRDVWFRGRDILFTEFVTAGEKLRKAAEAAAKAEAERKLNPHPGREPKLRTPGGRLNKPDEGKREAHV
jgi:hypothetical protein